MYFSVNFQFLSYNFVQIFITYKYHTCARIKLLDVLSAVSVLAVNILPVHRTRAARNCEVVKVIVSVVLLEK